MAKVGVIGSGDVGKVLALGFKKHGHDVQLGSREGNKLSAWSAEHGVEGTFASVAAHGDVVVGAGAEAAVQAVGAGLTGKVVVDATNPLSGPPVNGRTWANVLASPG